MRGQTVSKSDSPRENDRLHNLTLQVSAPLTSVNFDLSVLTRLTSGLVFFVPAKILMLIDKDSINLWSSFSLQSQRSLKKY